MGGGEGREFKVLLRSSLTTCRLGSELSPTDSETTLMAKCTNSLQACSDTYPVKEKAKVNLASHPFSSSNEKEHQVSSLS